MSCARAWAWGEVPELLRAAGHDGGRARPAAARGGDADGARGAARGGGRPAAVRGRGRPLLRRARRAAGGRGARGALRRGRRRGRDRRATTASRRTTPAATRRRRGGPRRAARGDGMWTAGEPAPGDPDWFDRLEPMPLSAMEAPIALTGEVDRLPRTFVLCGGGGWGSRPSGRWPAAGRSWRWTPSHALPLLDPARCAELLLEARRSGLTVPSAPPTNSPFRCSPCPSPITTRSAPPPACSAVAGTGRRSCGRPARSPPTRSSSPRSRRPSSRRCCAFLAERPRLPFRHLSVHAPVKGVESVSDARAGRARVSRLPLAVRSDRRAPGPDRGSRALARARPPGRGGEHGRPQGRRPHRRRARAAVRRAARGRLLPGHRPRPHDRPVDARRPPSCWTPSAAACARSTCPRSATGSHTTLTARGRGAVRTAPRPLPRRALDPRGRGARPLGRRLPPRHARGRRAARRVAPRRTAARARTAPADRDRARDPRSRTGEAFAPIAAARARTAARPGRAPPNASSDVDARPRRLRRPAGLVGPPRGDERLRRRRDRAVQRRAPRRRQPDAARRSPRRSAARRPAGRACSAQTVWLADLTEKIGLDRDTNTNLTRRMLFLLESVAVAGEQAHADGPRRSCCTPTSPPTSATTVRRASCSTTSSATGARSRSTSRASSARARGRGGGCGTPSCASAARSCSRAGCCRCSSATRCRRARCRPSWPRRFAEPPLDRIAGAFVEREMADAGARAMRAYGAFLDMLDDEATRSELAGPQRGRGGRVAAVRAGPRARGGAPVRPARAPVRGPRARVAGPRVPDLLKG